MKKRVSVILALIMLISIFIGTTKIYGKENLIKVGDILVVSPYDFREVYLEKYEDENFYYADIYSKTTKKILVRYKEEKPDGIALRRCGGETTRNLFTTFYENPVEVTVRAECLVYIECLSTGNITHIREINSADHYISSSGYFELRNKSSNTWGNIVQCSGTMEIDYNRDFGGEYSLEFLETVGFSVTYHEGKVYHLRRAYNRTVEFR